jgi:hypothetical protein
MEAPAREVTLRKVEGVMADERDFIEREAITACLGPVLDKLLGTIP